MDQKQRDSLRRLVEEALPAAREQAQLIADMRAAFDKGDEQSALALARRLCGLPALRIAS